MDKKLNLVQMQDKTYRDIVLKKMQTNRNFG